MTTSPRITQLLEDIRSLDEGRYTLVQALRQQILAMNPAVVEEVKYGGLLFGTDKPFCGVFAYTQHVSLEFGAGAALPDPHNMLEGSGKLRRHIKLTTLQDMADKHVHAYLALALQASLPKP